MLNVPPIDPIRGRELMQRFSRGETLTSEEQAYLNRVREEIRKRARNRQQQAILRTLGRLV